MNRFAWTIGCLLLAACGDGSNATHQNAQTQSKPIYLIPKEITLDFSAERGNDGKMFIVGSTNLPQDTRLDYEIDRTDGRLWLGDHMSVVGGRFRSAGFTDGRDPVAAGKYKVRVYAYFNGAWQSPDILKIFGDGGANLKGPLVKLKDPDVIDSDKILDTTRVVEFAPPSDTAAAIALVSKAVLTTDDGRSSMNVGDCVAFYMKFPGLQPAEGWMAQKSEGTKYLVTFGFINGTLGREKAIWETDTATKTVRYVNKNAKTFSWVPAD